MKKLLILLFSCLLLSSPSVFAQEDLSKINIDNLKRLSSSEIINTFSNTSSMGYYSKDIYGIDDYKFITYLYASGDLDMNASLFTASGKWKVYDNQFCSKATKVSVGIPEKMFICSLVYTDFNEGEYYWFLPGLGLYAKTTAVMPLID